MKKRMTFLSILMISICLFLNTSIANEIFKSHYDESSKTLIFENQVIKNNKKNIDEIKEFISSYKDLKCADMRNVNMAKRIMDEVFDSFPDIEFKFTLKYGKKVFDTDILYYTSAHSQKSTRFREGYYDSLRFCKKLQILDLGHNQIGSLDFVKNLKDLKVLILADNDISDISPLANLHNLEYFEAFKNRIKDLSPLANLKKLKDLNLCYNSICDIEPLLNISSIERIWISNNKISDKSKELLSTSIPNAIMNFTVYSPTSGGWRDHERYFSIKKLLEGK